MSEITVSNLKRIFANPVYCVKKCEGWNIAGKPIVTKKVWKGAVIKMIESKEISLEEWLDLLIENLEGKYYE